MVIVMKTYYISHGQNGIIFIKSDEINNYIMGYMNDCKTLFTPIYRYPANEILNADEIGRLTHMSIDIHDKAYTKRVIVRDDDEEYTIKVAPEIPIVCVRLPLHKNIIYVIKRFFRNIKYNIKDMVERW